MPKGKGKGSKKKSKGNGPEKRELEFKEEGQEYAQVLRMLGNGRVEAVCFDGQKRLCHIRGKMRKRVWIQMGDIILLGLRDYQDNKADVILKYSCDEARRLKAFGELPESGTCQAVAFCLINFPCCQIRAESHLPSAAKINEVDLNGDEGEADFEFVEGAAASGSDSDEGALQDIADI
mmetsp:Transcript_30328/g.69987  ORF Transcript_30328/g.69987 Transcript_30328/m.69987 type:complete len:178 (+) Transcript_30328:49-582(+)